MKSSDYNYRHILIGVVSTSVPFVALGVKFGALKGLLIFFVFVAFLLAARLTIYLFTRRSNLAKGTAIAIHGNLIFILFLPKHLKQKVNKLEEYERKDGKLHD